jgi:TetR/AcrR family transcriptional regulator, regulator of autoinduction and epiphytic fitness
MTAGRKRRAILDAALHEFETHGFADTSMDRIASRAGVSKRTVYNHFAGKEALFEAIIDALSDRVGETARIEFAPDIPPESQLRDLGERYVDMLTAPCTVALARVALAEMLRSPDVAARVYGLMRARQTGLCDWLQSADRQGCLAVPDPQVAADQFLGVLKSFAFWPHMVGGQAVPAAAERRAIVAQAVDLVLHRYAPGRGAPR